MTDLDRLLARAADAERAYHLARTLAVGDAL